MIEIRIFDVFFISSSCSVSSKYLMRSMKGTTVGNLWFFLILKRFLIVKYHCYNQIFGIPPCFSWAYILSQSNVHLWHRWISCTWCPLTPILAFFLYMTSLLDLIMESIGFYANFRSRLCHAKIYWWSWIHIFYNISPWLWIIPVPPNSIIMI